MELAILGPGNQIRDGQLVLEVMGQLTRGLADKNDNQNWFDASVKSTKIQKGHDQAGVKEELQSNVNRLYTSTDKLKNHLKNYPPRIIRVSKKLAFRNGFLKNLRRYQN